MYIIIWSNKTMVNLRLPWLQEPWFFLSVKTMAFVSEHGNSERILDVLVVKLLTTLKHVINLKKKFHRIMNVA